MLSNGNCDAFPSIPLIDLEVFDTALPEIEKLTPYTVEIEKHDNKTPKCITFSTRHWAMNDVGFDIGYEYHYIKYSITTRKRLGLYINTSKLKSCPYHKYVVRLDEWDTFVTPATDEDRDDYFPFEPDQVADTWNSFKDTVYKILQSYGWHYGFIGNIDRKGNEVKEWYAQKIEPERVNYDAKPGDIISVNGNQVQVIDTYPRKIAVEQMYTSRELYSYAELLNSGAVYISKV